MLLKRGFIIFYFLGVVLHLCASGDSQFIIDLKGKWNFSFDNKTYNDEVILPGTTDTNRKGKVNENRNETTFLSRYYKFEGKAWYSKEVVIPENWGDKVIRLFWKEPVLRKCGLMINMWVITVISRLLMCMIYQDLSLLESIV